MDKVRRFLEMIRFSHTIFALPFALLAAAMAWAVPTAAGEAVPFHWLQLVGILVCMVAARSAAMAFNRLVDRKIDAENPRTKNRHLPSGQLSVGSVVGFTVICSLAFVAGTLLFLPNRLPLYLSVPVLGILCFYSYTKRFTSLAHFWLGISLMLAPIAVWIALRGEAVTQDIFDLTPAVALGLAVLFWVSGFDMIYACQDFEYDSGAGLRSVPARFGIAGALRIAAICHAVMVAILVALPWMSQWAGLELGFGWVYAVGVIAVAALLAYEHRLVSPDDLTRVNQAFFNVNAIISFGLLAVCSIDLLV